jgi:hypothetical protein
MVTSAFTLAQAGLDAVNKDPMSADTARLLQVLFNKSPEDGKTFITCKKPVVHDRIYRTLTLLSAAFQGTTPNNKGEFTGILGFKDQVTDKGTLGTSDVVSLTPLQKKRILSVHRELTILPPQAIFCNQDRIKKMKVSDLHYWDTGTSSSLPFGKFFPPDFENL